MEKTPNADSVNMRVTDTDRRNRVSYYAAHMMKRFNKPVFTDLSSLIL